MSSSKPTNWVTKNAVFKAQHLSAARIHIRLVFKKFRRVLLFRDSKFRKEIGIAYTSLIYQLPFSYRAVLFHPLKPRKPYSSDEIKIGMFKLSHHNAPATNYAHCKSTTFFNYICLNQLYSTR